MKSFKQYIKEDVYGGLSTIYHRTKSIASREAIKNSGFESGSGDMYGKGIYGTYTLKSQLNKKMKDTYGDYIIKAKVNNNRILFLDMNQAKKVYGKNHSLVDQLKNINPSLITNEIEEISNELLQKTKYTSKIALRLLGIREIKKEIYGISFTGQRDGNVLVIYNEDSVTPMSYNSTKNNFSKLDLSKWIDIKNLKLIQRGLDTTLDRFYGNKSNDYKLVSGNDTDLIKNHKWFLDAKYESAEIDVSKKDFLWKDGKWKDGTWKDGTWESGTWWDGTWERGIWEDGIWEYGTWKDGTWKDGTWKDGTWNGGTWKDGVWENGNWDKGTWEAGYWYDGTWKRGTWKKGVWSNGNWNGGTWKGGMIFSIKYGEYVSSSIDPKTFCQYESQSSSINELQSKVR